ncbi:hypothetical protein GCM10010435_82630 [Winogradskya consettensis]|uniref:Uncharacterized protein n=1 Tax=Winogradskya consettensis TaxID=113560 RepID=A0A919SVL3_9ACTN|nr:hypothetical protein [Actinoplanes consettensis]GIM79175.1 hypothetical protein Aco04nite_64200 [Actinoplanes consettensis]
MNYEARKTAATATVARWEWYTWPGLDPRPLHFERDLLKPGRRLDARPPLNRDVLRIGFDTEGRVAVTEKYSGFLRGRLNYETFMRYAGDVVEAAHFDADGQRIYLHEYRYVDGLMRSAELTARRGSDRESYEYTDGLITRVLHDLTPRLVAEHDDHGLVRIVAGRELRYERPPAGFDLEAECRAVEDALVALVPEAVAALKFDGPVSRIALSYHLANDLDCEIYIATDVDAEYEWSPPDYNYVADIDLGNTGPIRLVRQELTLLDADDHDAGAGSEWGRRVMCAAATRLRTHDWTAVFPVTADFLLYTVDLELVDLERNLAECG